MSDKKEIKNNEVEKAVYKQQELIDNLQKQVSELTATKEAKVEKKKPEFFNELKKQLDNYVSTNDKDEREDRLLDLDKYVEGNIDKLLTLKDTDGNAIFDSKEQLMRALKDFTPTSNSWFTSLSNKLTDITVRSGDENLFPWVDEIFPQKMFKGNVGEYYGWTHSNRVESRAYSDPTSEILPLVSAKTRIQPQEFIAPMDYSMATEVQVDPKTFSKGSTLTSANLGGLIATHYIALNQSQEINRSIIAKKALHRRFSSLSIVPTELAPAGYQLADEGIFNLSAAEFIITFINTQLANITRRGTNTSKIGGITEGSPGVDYRRAKISNLSMVLDTVTASRLSQYMNSKTYNLNNPNNPLINQVKWITVPNLNDEGTLDDEAILTGNSTGDFDALTATWTKQDGVNIYIFEGDAAVNKNQFKYVQKTVWKNGLMVSFAAERGGFCFDPQMMGAHLVFPVQDNTDGATVVLNVANSGLTMPQPAPAK